MLWPNRRSYTKKFEIDSEPFLLLLDSIPLVDEGHCRRAESSFRHSPEVCLVHINDVDLRF